MTTQKFRLLEASLFFMLLGIQNWPKHKCGTPHKHVFSVWAVKLTFGPKINVLLLDTRVLMKCKKSNFSYKELLFVGKRNDNFNRHIT